MSMRAAIRRIVNIGRTLTLVPRSAEPFATHLPVLIGLARLRKIRRILEFGSGRYSTLAFLNRAAFPDLEALESYENNAEWHEKVAQLAGGDSRLKLTYVKGFIHEAIDARKLPTYDLIFIDDSINRRQRAATIGIVAAARPALVAIHDFENFAYRYGVKGFSRVYRFTAFLPNTGVAWNDETLTLAELQALNDLISKNRQLAPQDLNAWANVMKG